MTEMTAEFRGGCGNPHKQGLAGSLSLTAELTAE